MNIVDNLSKKLKRMIIYLINEDREDSEKEETGSVCKLKK